MIEIRACTPDDAAAVSTLLSELGYTVPIRQATENIQELGKTGADPIIVAVADGRVVGFLAAPGGSCNPRRNIVANSITSIKRSVPVSAI